MIFVPSWLNPRVLQKVSEYDMGEWYLADMDITARWGEKDTMWVLNTAIWRPTEWPLWGWAKVHILDLRGEGCHWRRIIWIDTIQAFPSGRVTEGITHRTGVGIAVRILVGSRFQGGHKRTERRRNKKGCHQQQCYNTNNFRFHFNKFWILPFKYFQVSPIGLINSAVNHIRGVHWGARGRGTSQGISLYGCRAVLQQKSLLHRGRVISKKPNPNCVENKTPNLSGKEL